MRSPRAASLFFVIGLLAPFPCLAEAVATVTHLGGILHATAGDGANRMLSINSEIMEGDTLKTEKDTYARIRFVDGGDVILRPLTVFKVKTYSYRPVETPDHPDKIRFDLLKGGVRSKTGAAGHRNPASFELRTTTAILGVRGTDLGARLCNDDCNDVTTPSGDPPQNGLYTDTAQGTAIVHNDMGSVDVPAGSYSYVPNAKTAPKLVPASHSLPVSFPPAFKRPAGNLGLDKSGSNACSVE